jgi:hypothetical protein
MFLFVINKIDKIITLVIVFIFVFKFGIILVVFIFFYLFKIVNDVSDEFKYKKTIVFLLMILVLSAIKNTIRYY